MGVRGLFSFLKAKGCVVNINAIQTLIPKRIGIDISYYMYRWQGDAERVLELIQSLKPHKTILIFDGKAPSEKQHEHERRKQIRDDDNTSAKQIREGILSCSDLSEEQKLLLERKAEEYERRGWQNTKEVRHAFKTALYKAKIPLLKSKGEADPLLVGLATAGELDIVISGDMDLLVLGVPVLWCPIGTTNTFHAFNRERVLLELGLTDIQFRSFCAMCCTDYTDSSQRLEILKAYQSMRVYKNIATIKERHPNWLNEWPTQSHPFLIGVGNPDLYILDEQLPWYNAWKNGEEMPYKY